MTEQLMAGIDLHSNNVVIGIVNQDGERRKHRKLECDLKQVDDFLRPMKEQLKSIAVESTYNWYWLVDGLRARGYPVHLANPAKMDQYSGIKHADDRFCKEICVSGFLFCCCCNVPCSNGKVKRAGGELRALARAPCGRTVESFQFI
jgi:hypothetical protein